MTDYAQVSVRILDKEYRVSCPASERTDLLSGHVVGLDRIAVIAALNMANELLHAQARGRLVDTDFSNRLKLISERVENVLGESRHLDL